MQSACQCCRTNGQCGAHLRVSKDLTSRATQWPTTASKKLGKSYAQSPRSDWHETRQAAPAAARAIRTVPAIATSSSLLKNYTTDLAVCHCLLASRAYCGLSPGTASAEAVARCFLNGLLAPAATRLLIAASARPCRGGRPGHWRRGRGRTAGRPTGSDTPRGPAKSSPRRRG